MAETTLDQELKAIKTITEALEPLDVETRQRALNYAMQHLRLTVPSASAVVGRSAEAHISAESPSPAKPISPSGQQGHVTDIRSLKEQKKPATDIEMATLVAYYLKHETADDDHKDEIGTEDIEKYFVQAGYPLPTNKQYTLPNAKKAGYLENASRGKYKLNSVGHNLVAHGMPRTESTTVAKPKRSKKAAKKKPAKKKASKRNTKK